MTETIADVRAETRARIERAALDLFVREGFERVPIDEIAEVAGISRRTYFRYFATKADAVWGDFDAHVSRLADLLAATPADQPVLAAICGAYVEVNDYPRAELPLLRERIGLILSEPALQAHSQLRYADVDHVVAEHVAVRIGSSPRALLPRLVATAARAAATTAFEVWLGSPARPLSDLLQESFGQLARGFPDLRRASGGAAAGH